MSQARILAVDDQLYFRVFLEDLLAESGYEVKTAPGGAEALAILEVERFDVVLTDLVMPGMDGSELVQRIKEQWPEQEVIVVTSVGDVKTAVDAMKLGATDYLLKPLDRAALLRTLESLLEQRRLQQEHRQLVAENLEYMSVFTRYERVLGLFSSLAVESLADRMVEAFCLETNAHGGVVWLARPGNPERLRLTGVGGLVRVEDEQTDLDAGALPDALRPLAEEDGPLLVEGKDTETRSSLYLPLRSDGRLMGILRLTDKLDGSEFDAADLEVAGRLASFAAQAVANALQFRALERRSFRDATTHAYTRAYFEDVVDNEIQKAHRFGRTFSLVRVELDEAADLRDGLTPAAWSELLAGVGAELADALRSTDLLAVEGDGRFCALLPESETLGATMAKRRLRAAVERAGVIRELESSARPTVLAASVTFPTDGHRHETLAEGLGRRIDEDRASMVRAFELDTMPFRGLVDTLLADAPLGRPETAEQVTRFVFAEVRRRAHERGLLYVSPGASLLGPLREGLAELRDTEVRTEIVLVADRRADVQPGLPVTWVSPMRTGSDAPFLVYYGEGPPYAMIRDASGSEPEVSLYHTSDPVVVEHLAFQLGRDLGIPISD